VWALDQCITDIPRVRRGDVPLPQEEAIQRIASVTKAFSDPIRLKMVYLLSKQSDLSTCEFEELLDLSQSKVSYHLKILLDAGVIDREIHGSWSHYSLRNPKILEQVHALSQ